MINTDFLDYMENVTNEDTFKKQNRTIMQTTSYLLPSAHEKQIFKQLRFTFKK